MLANVAIGPQCFTRVAILVIGEVAISFELLQLNLLLCFAPTHFFNFLFCLSHNCFFGLFVFVLHFTLLINIQFLVLEYFLLCLSMHRIIA